MRARLLPPLLLLRRLLRTLFRFAIAIPLTMTIAASAPGLFALLGRLLASVGQPAFRAILMRLPLRLLLRLLRSRRPLLLVAIAAGAGTIPLRAARFLPWTAIATRL